MEQKEKKYEVIFGYHDINEIAHKLVELMDRYHIFTFSGPLGAGKTTLVRSMLEAKGIKGPITSPTFTYVNVYQNDKGERFNHFDLYRIGHIDEFLAAGFDEFLHMPNSWSFIEWPAVIEPILEGPYCQISIDYVSEDSRVLQCYVISHK
jgi:tRNA threonylcarbamoyladenosine biosynthesis protein TsaE